MKRTAIELLGSAKLVHLLYELFDKTDGLCPYSGRKLTIGIDAELDHIIPESRGGTNDLSNLQWVYGKVNQMKYSYSEEEFLSLVMEIYRHRNLN